MHLLWLGAAFMLAAVFAAAEAALTQYGC